MACVFSHTDNNTSLSYGCLAIRCRLHQTASAAHRADRMCAHSLAAAETDHPLLAVVSRITKGNAANTEELFCRVRSDISDTLCYTLGLSQTDVVGVGRCFVSPLAPSALLRYWMREKWFFS
jgi:hypothetical protein